MVTRRTDEPVILRIERDDTFLREAWTKLPDMVLFLNWWEVVHSSAFYTT